MIFLLGASGYVGSAFQRELTRLGLPYRAFSRSQVDYPKFRVFLELLRSGKPDLVINCGGFTGKPNVDACETQRSETVRGNIVLAQTVAQACDVAGVRLGTISSGCIYTGAKVQDASGAWNVREDLTSPDLAGLLGSRSSRVRGFGEDDPANFTLETGSSFYSGTKAIAETVLREFPEAYIWRLRMPFEERNHPRNYLTKLQTYAKVYPNWNSLSHLGDFVATCLQVWQAGLRGGAYNIVNPGYVSTREVTAMIGKLLRPGWQPDFFADDAEFYGTASHARRSNCLLEQEKLTAAGIKLRDVESALADSLKRWQ